MADPPADSADGGDSGDADAEETNSFFRTLAKGGTVLFGGIAFEIGVSFLAKLIIARELGRFDYGVVSVGITTMTMVSMLSLLGLNTGVARYLPRDDDRRFRRGVLWSAYVVVVPLSLLAALGVYLLAGAIATGVFGDPAVAPVLRTFAAAIPLVSFVTLTIGVSRGVTDVVPRLAIQNLTVPLSRFGFIALALLLGLGAVGVSWAYVLAHALGALGAGYYLVRRTDLLSHGSKQWLFGELLRFSGPLLVTTSMVMVFSNMDTYVLGYFWGTGPVGVYNVVYPVAEMMVVVLTSFSFLFMPLLSNIHARGDEEEMARIYRIVTKWVFVISYPLLVLFVVFGHEAIRFTFGAEYTRGTLALAILAAGFFFRVATGPNQSTLQSIGRTRAIMYDNVFAAALNLVLNLLLIPRYAIVGAAVATTASYVTLNCLFAYQLYADTDIHPLSASLLRPAGVLLPLAAAGWVAHRLVGPLSIVEFVAVGVVCVASYPVVILLLGVVEPEEVMLVLSFEEKYDIDLGPLKSLAKRLI
jgi:O-antigen/teichoic acid export membrane protein